MTIVFYSTFAVLNMAVDWATYLGVRAEPLVALMWSSVTGAVNLASGHTTTVQGFARRIACRFGHDDLLDFGALPTPAHGPPDLTGITRRLQEEVGYMPADPADGIDAAIAYWRGIVASV